MTTLTSHVANGKPFDLGCLLEAVLGSKEVYFQAPPQGHRMKYPAIIYERRTGDTSYADDIPYVYTTAYTLTVITKDPYDSTPDKVTTLPMCKFDRHMYVNNLNHDIYIIYF